jgi:hypothetical protein
LLSEQMSKDDKKDAQEIREFMKTPAFEALGRLLNRMNADVIDRWSRTETGPESKKAWLAGSREQIAAIIPRLKDLAELADSIEEEERHLASVGKSDAIDGQGSGDLSLG